ncbi:MAG: hypothetical protein AB7G44_02875 [Bacteroidia bacterium]
MALKPFSAVVNSQFRLELGFDTNLLMYLIDNEYPDLNQAIVELNKYGDFVRLNTNRYALFELYEKRKEAHFIKHAFNSGYHPSKINSDKFSVQNSQKHWLLNFISKRKKWNKKFQKATLEYLEKLLSKRALTEDLYFFSVQKEIMAAVNADIPKIKNDFGIDIIGTLHDNLWQPTFDLILNSRISREDSLIAIAFLYSQANVREKNVVILTNDGDFRSFHEESKKQGLISTVFANSNLSEPVIDRIANLKNLKNGEFNLRNSGNLNIENSIIEYIKRNIIEKNSSHFLGFTDEKILPNKTDIIGIKLTGTAKYSTDNYLLFIGNKLDFLYIVPYNITEFRKEDGNQIDFPLRKEHKKACYKHLELQGDDPDKEHEQLILSSLKQSGNLVFVSPDFI